jgi:hypothetical protein
MRLALIAALATALWAPIPALSEPVRIIFDTDMGNDVDDALALAILHALESRGEAKLLAVTVTKDNPYAAAFVDVVNTFYGRGGVPIGIVKNGKTPNDSPMIRVPSERKNPDGSYVYPRRLALGAARAGGRKRRQRHHCSSGFQHQPGAPARFRPGRCQPARRCGTGREKGTAAGGHGGKFCAG